MRSSRTLRASAGLGTCHNSTCIPVLPISLTRPGHRAIAACSCSIRNGSESFVKRRTRLMSCGRSCVSWRSIWCASQYPQRACRSSETRIRYPPETLDRLQRRRRRPLLCLNDPVWRCQAQSICAAQRPFQCDARRARQAAQADGRWQRSARSSSRVEAHHTDLVVGRRHDLRLHHSPRRLPSDA